MTFNIKKTKGGWLFSYGFFKVIFSPFLLTFTIFISVHGSVWICHAQKSKQSPKKFTRFSWSWHKAAFNAILSSIVPLDYLQIDVLNFCFSFLCPCSALVQHACVTFLPLNRVKWQSWKPNDQKQCDPHSLVAENHCLWAHREKAKNPSLTQG